MNTKSFGEIAKWMRDTDLVEIKYKKDGNGFEIRTEDAPVKTNIPECQLMPVVAQAVGIFRLLEWVVKPLSVFADAEGSGIDDLFFCF